MPPLASISAKLPSQQTIADEFTLNREQRTGKSQPIRARSKYFLVTKRVRKMRNPRPIRVGDLKVEKEWYLVECLLIDQMCMVSPNLLAKHVDPQVPFGGVNVTSFGNYMQYGTMCELPLLTDFTKPSRNKSTKLPNENCGCTISESAWTIPLRRLQVRLVWVVVDAGIWESTVPCLRDHPWNQVNVHYCFLGIYSGLSQRGKNAVENWDKTKAMQMCQGKAIEDSILGKKPLTLYDSKTEHLPGYLPLVPGMPVILQQKIIELGLINGTKVIFRQLVYEANSLTLNRLSEEFSSDAQYVHQSTYALVETPKSKLECQLIDLESKIVPIPSGEQTFRINPCNKVICIAQTR